MAADGPGRGGAWWPGGAVVSRLRIPPRALQPGDRLFTSPDGPVDVPFEVDEVTRTANGDTWVDTGGWGFRLRGDVLVDVERRVR